MEDQRAAAEPIQDREAARRFAEQLRALRTAVGDPSFRKMAGRSGRISHTTLHEAAAGTRFPSWETTREFVRACGGDEADWRRRWQEAQRSETTPPAIPEPVASPAEPVEAGDAPPRRMLWLTAVAAAAMAIVAVLGFTVRGKSAPDGAEAAAPSASGFSDSLIPGDSSRFVGDVTIPDGTKVKVNAHFVKVWALANVGTVDWHNRFLERTDPGDTEGCQVPDRVTIGDTPPGEQVMISVPVTAPARPGKCWVSWKMVDAQGQAFFPSRRPVYFMVTVTA
jgi:hypothetical protein